MFSAVKLVEFQFRYDLSQSQIITNASSNELPLRPLRLYLRSKKKLVKPRNIVLLILLIIVIDQVLKIWIKTHMPLSYNWDESHTMITPYDRGIRPLGWSQDWFQIYFVENEGMAWGWKFGGEWGKMALTLFRLVAVIFGV